MLIVTHFNPDIDAIGAVWLLRKFGSGRFRNAKVDFVPAGETYENQPVDTNPQIVHVDTGLGRFDHHQIKDSDVCAASLVLDEIAKSISKPDYAILKRLVRVVCDIDHFKECLWPQADDDRYDFLVTELLNGLKIDNELDDQGLIDFGGVCLTGIYQSLRNKAHAEEELAKGITVITRWGKTLFVESSNSETLHLGQKKGYNMVVRKDPRQGTVKIGLRPDTPGDVADLLEELKAHDPQADWYPHSSGRLLLNGSSKNPKMKPSRLKLTELMEIIKNINSKF